MNYQQQPYSPYQPPGHGYPPAHAPFNGVPGNGPGAWSKWVYLATAFLGVMGFSIGMVLMVLGADSGSGSGSDEVLAGIGVAVFCASFMFFIVKVIIRLIWLHGCWSWIPPEYRYTGGGKQVTPGTAVGFLFIPYFNIYWTFIAYVGLCSALDRLRLRYQTMTPAPTAIATCACIAELFPFINLMVAPFLWFFYMRIFDQITSEIGEAMAREANNGQQPQAQQGWAPANAPVAYVQGGYGGGY